MRHSKRFLARILLILAWGTVRLLLRLDLHANLDTDRMRPGFFFYAAWPQDLTCYFVCAPDDPYLSVDLC